LFGSSNFPIFILSLWLAALVGVRAYASEPVAADPSAPESSATAPEKSPAVLPVRAQGPAQKPAPAAAGQATFVGDDKCITCHDAQQGTLANTAHGRRMDPRSPAAKQGCESCHGPGSQHIEDPVTFKPLTFRDPQQADGVCTTCHSRGNHAFWDGSQHESRGLTCISCHSVHHSKSPSLLLKEETQMGVCASCHRDKVSKLDRTGHMPVREGKMECSSCHNPHGATNVRLLRKGDSIAESCTSCHAEKRGPYLWEHPPSRDGCQTCHDPHGSSNDRMLIARTPILCQRCHVATRHPSTIYDAGLIGTSSRVYARSCVTCHSAIHGSNHPSGQRFVR
jgi:DmsE family decaheme c-type cytochrome